MRKPIVARDVDDLVERLVRPDDHVHLAATPSRPNALTYALCRTFGAEGHLTVSTTAVHSSAHALALSGCADKVIASFAGDTYPSPRPNVLYERLHEGRPFSFEAWSLLSYMQRLIAGALGVPYAVTGSLTGTDLADGKPGGLYSVPDPARPDEQVTLLSPLRPDVTLVHGVCADEDGNIVLVPPLGEGAWAAYAARRGVIASVERIVGRKQLRAMPDRVLIPGQRVLGLCEAEFGAHPQSLRTADEAGVPGYLDDYAFLEEIVASCGGPQRGTDWYRDWVSEAGSHRGYLHRLGPARRARLSNGARTPQAGRPPEHDEHYAEMEALFAAELGPERAAELRLLAPEASAPDRIPDPEQAPDERPATRQEQLIVLGARAVADRVRTGRYDTLLAGIGSSHMAAWLAAALLRQGGHEVKVVAELGMYGFVPQGGDVFLFSLRHAATAEQLSGIPEILGGMVAANPGALGVLSAGEIDQSGTINTSRDRDGRWLTGSGGANDIAAGADCVVIAPASPRRYVAAVSYRTSRGDRVQEVVSQFGRFRRTPDGAGFRLATWLPADDQRDTVLDDPAEVERRAGTAVAESTAWAVPVAGVVVEKPITAAELDLLRSLDPEGRYR